MIKKYLDGKTTLTGIWGLVIVTVLHQLGAFETTGLLSGIDPEVLMTALSGLTAHGVVNKYVKQVNGEPQVPKKVKMVPATEG